MSREIAGGAFRFASRRRYSSQVLSRALAILEHFASTRAELRLSDLASLGLPKSTLYRLLEILRGHGLLTLDFETGRYRLGLRLFELGTAAISQVEVSSLAQPFLARLVDQTEETANLGLLDRWDVVFLARAESPRASRLPSSLGRRSPAYCSGIGKALLAFQDEPALQAFFSETPLQARTRHTLTDPADLRRELREIRTRGWAVDDEEAFPGIRCVAAPVTDARGRAVCGVSVAGPTTRMAERTLPRYVDAVLAAARELSVRLAGVRPA